MKRWHDLLPNRAIIAAMILVVALQLNSSHFGFSLINKATALATIPLLLAIYFYRHRVMAHIFYTVFILYFLGILFNSLDYLVLSSKLSEFCFLGVYVLLAFVMFGKLKRFNFDVLVSIYLILIFLVSTYFTYAIFSAAKENFADSVIFTLSIIKAIALVLVSLLAFAIYISKETSQSILFLIIVCCFVFSDGLSFITTMYVHYWLFEGLQNILQAAGLFLFCIYVYNFQDLLNGYRKDRSQLISSSKKVSA